MASGAPGKDSSACIWTEGSQENKIKNFPIMIYKGRDRGQIWQKNNYGNICSAIKTKVFGRILFNLSIMWLSKSIPSQKQLNAIMELTFKGDEATA